MDGITLAAPSAPEEPAAPIAAHAASPAAAPPVASPAAASPVASPAVDAVSSENQDAEAAAVEIAVPESAPAQLKPDVEMEDAQPRIGTQTSDVVMEDAESQFQDSGVEHGGELGGNTQGTEVSDAPASPAEDQSLQPTSMSNLDVGGSQDPISAPATAETSLTDIPSQAPVKVAREREEDDVEERSAKRTRTDEAQVDEAPKANQPGNELDVAAQPPPGPPDASGDPVQLDAPVVPRGAPIRLERARGEPGTLGDPAQEGQPLSAFANREIRKVLGSVKKTKAGGFFKDPVKTRWPEVWEQYLAKVETPMDIGHMERSLRSNTYPTLGAFLDDVHLLYENCVRFNGVSHEMTVWAQQLVENIFVRLVDLPAEEPTKTAKKEPKQQSSRHTEPRVSTQQTRRESRGATATAAPPSC